MCLEATLSHLCPFWSFTTFPGSHLGGTLTPSATLYSPLRYVKVPRSVSQQKIQEDSSSLWSTLVTADLFNAFVMVL